tara:strand:- start:520 stop:861 length:342 start_codon:yes stop_codon:yes gene_type:complete
MKTATKKTTKRRKKAIKYNVGDVLEVKTFAGPIIQKRVLKKIHTKTKWGSLSAHNKKEIIEVKGFEGCFVRRKDLYALKEACVPYSGKEKLSKTESFTFDWEIIRIIRKAKKK